jgi:murein DD-endopeptidase MepM/ murein hydrolase activator NlpD
VATVTRFVPFTFLTATVALAAAATPGPSPDLLDRAELAPGSDAIFGVKPPGLVRDPRAPRGAEVRGLLARTARDPEPRERDAPEAAFPVGGSVTWGDGLGERVGGHDGVDVMADCGLPLRAVRGGRVEVAEEDGAAGRHVVIRTKGGGADVSMHLQEMIVDAGDRVEAGDRLGTVGDTGNATACHLHFERWTAPGWHRGRATDPEPALRRLQRLRD